MNKNLLEKYKQDFNTVLSIYENTNSHDELIGYLKSGSIAEKQAATIKLDGIYNKEEAEIFVANLTGCDGKIREAVSFKLKEFLPLKPSFYVNFVDIFLDAIIDINGNICRNVIDAIQPLKAFPEFTSNFCDKLTQKTGLIIPPILAFDIQERKYKINKEVFKLYWYLETISYFTEFIDLETIFEILSKTKNIDDYTIREKTAKILTKIENQEKFDKIKSELKKDKNYYVRRVWENILSFITQFIKNIYVLRNF